MPKRPRSHQLEDLSIAAFKAMLPPAWVCREKGDDYGIDLEVEIFDENENATGLMFFVQLKATDDATKERKVSIPVDRILYLQSFDVPSILVRYCAATKRLFWKWTFDALSDVTEGNASATVVFDQMWQIDTPLHVASTLVMIKRLKNPRKAEKLIIGVSTVLSARKSLLVRGALSAVVDRLPFLSLADSEPGALALDIKFTEGQIRIALTPIGFLEIDLNDFSEQRIKVVLAYGLAAVFTRMGLHSHATAAARFCSEDQEQGSVHPELAYFACLALQDDPISSVRTALKNGLQRSDNWAHGAFLTALLSSKDKSPQSEMAGEIFFQAALGESGNDLSTWGNLQYSMGNFRASRWRHRSAIYAFNQARKARPRYFDSEYFFSEVGGSLFLAGRFRCSAKAYQAALRLGDSPRTAFRLADALLFSGEYARAYSLLTSLDLKGGESFASEAKLKAMISSWQVEVSSIKNPNDISQIATVTKRAHAEGDMQSAFLGCLLLAFSCAANEFAWSRAILLAASHYEVGLRDVMTCAEEATGLAAYNIFRADLVELNAEDDMLIPLDEMCSEVNAEVRSRAQRGVTVRLLYDDRTDVYVQN